MHRPLDAEHREASAFLVRPGHSTPRAERPRRYEVWLGMHGHADCPGGFRSKPAVATTVLSGSVHDPRNGSIAGRHLFARRQS